LDQTKDNKIGICCFSTMQATLRRKKAMTRWLGIRILSSRGETCLSAAVVSVR